MTDYPRDMKGYGRAIPDPQWPKTVLQVGLGAASVTKFLYRHRPDCRQTIAEINPAVVPVAKQMFKLPDDPQRIDIQIADGVKWMHETRGRFDLIIVDGYDHHARFGGLGNQEFYRDCRARLSKRGVLALNLFGRARGYSRQITGLTEAFSGRVLPLPANDEGNAIAFAFTGERVTLDARKLSDACRELADETGIKWGTSLKRLAQALYNASTEGATSI